MKLKEFPIKHNLNNLNEVKIKNRIICFVYHKFFTFSNIYFLICSLLSVILSLYLKFFLFHFYFLNLLYMLLINVVFSYIV